MKCKQKCQEAFSDFLAIFNSLHIMRTLIVNGAHVVLNLTRWIQKPNMKSSQAMTLGVVVFRMFQTFTSADLKVPCVFFTSAESNNYSLLFSKADTHIK